MVARFEFMTKVTLLAIETWVMIVARAVRRLMGIPSFPRMFHPILRCFVSNTAVLLAQHGESDDIRHVDVNKHEQTRAARQNSAVAHTLSACNECY